MIGFLTGKILEINNNQILIDVNGVGYLVSATNETASRSLVNNEIKLYIYTAVSENDIRLFGFGGQNELQLFKKLLGVKGVGPKTALNIFELPLGIIINAIVNSDHHVLSTISGLGRKTAERICLDLHDKLDSLAIEAISHDSMKADNSNGKIQEACEALCNLGCERNAVMRKLVLAPTNFSSEELVRWYLQNS
ncbi:MAG: Holliday junction branch migration protein RuvA [Patescibacteria group bacterium]|nr:Holliday junction branch migration protein RuvA [Patescibacteria group bacterium]